MRKKERERERGQRKELGKNDREVKKVNEVKMERRRNRHDGVEDIHG